MMLDPAIRRAREGDIEACEKIVRETASFVRAYLALYVRDQDAISDLAQETYIYAFEHLGDYALGTDFPAFLKTIARTRALRAYRERERKETAHRRYVAAVQSRLAEGAGKLDEKQPVEGLLAKLRDCVNRLSGHAKELVEMRYFQNKPAQEIAQLQGKTVNHVNVTLFRVRNQLAQCVERPVS